MAKQLETEALVLKVFDHGESDKIITLFSLDYGKITAIAKGAKRSKIRFVNKLELFTWLKITLAENRYSSMVRIDEAEVVNHFQEIRTKYANFAAATLCCELILNWTAERDEDKRIFKLIHWTFQELEMTRPLATTLFFHLHLLTILGFQLQFNCCGSCGSQDAKDGPYLFTPGNGGIVCTKCQDRNHPSSENQQLKIMLTNGTVKTLQKAQEMSLTNLKRLNFSHQSLAESIKLFRSHDSFLLKRDIHSWPLFLKACGII